MLNNPGLKLLVRVGTGMLCWSMALTGLAQSKETRELEETITTARRLEESLQEVPVSVTAISGEDLVARGVADLTGLQQRVPSLRVQASDINPKAFLIGIRGLRSASYAAMEDPVAGTYFAEAVQAHPYGFGNTLFDLESIQVLKGPQGTLFGRNHTAGAILVEPNKASIDDGLNGYVKLGLGEYNMKSFVGVLNVPINDMAALRLAYRRFERDGYTKNLLTGQRFDTSDDEVIRVSFLFQPTDNLRSHTVYDSLLDEGGPVMGQIPSFYEAGVSSFIRSIFEEDVALQQQLGERKIYNAIGSGLGGILSSEHRNDLLHPKNCVIYPNSTCRKHPLPTQEVDSEGILNNTAWTFDNGITIKNIISYRDVEHWLGASSIIPPASVTTFLPTVQASVNFGSGIQGVQDNQQEQTSEELQISGKAFDDKLSWIAGYFWFRERFTEDAPAYIFSTLTYNRTRSKGENEAQAVYAHGTYQFSDQWRLTLGVRYNEDDRALDNLSRNGFDPATGIPGPCQFLETPDGPRLPDDDCHVDGSENWNEVTWNTSLEYQTNDDTMVYGTVRRGYKAGGFARNSNLVTRATYEPEIVTDYELGVKADMNWGAMPVRANVAFYYTQIDDLQVGTAVANAEETTFFTFTNNAGEAEVKGDRTGDDLSSCRPFDDRSRGQLHRCRIQGVPGTGWQYFCGYLLYAV